MKKIYLNESQIRKHLLCENMNNIKLPKFLFDKIKNHKSFLGDNGAFPLEEDYPFDYKILKKRYIKVYENIQNLNLESLEYDFLIKTLSQLIRECKEIEKPLQANLCKICENVVIDLFKIPNETVNLTCELVDKIAPKKSYRTLPETSDSRKFDFEDMEDFHNVTKVILKRRLINSLIQGASYVYSTSYDRYINQIYKLDKRLIDLYDRITVINDYLLFIREVKINDKNPMQSAYVEVELGAKGNKTNITSQGLIFPFLLMETIRGFFELFASHGLPEDNAKALYIINQSDFLAAEPWDLRLGVGLWEFIGKNIENTHILPYLFTTLCVMNVNEFNSFLQEIFSQTKKGKTLLQNLIDESEYECDKFDFLDTMKKKNDEKALITDGDFTLDELDTYTLTEENNDETATNENNNSIDILAKVNPLDITFEVESAMPSWYNGDKMMYQLLPVVSGQTFLPQDGINFRAEDITVNGIGYYQPHIDVAQEYRRQGIAFNLYQAFILQGYPVCSLFKNRTISFYDEQDAVLPNDYAIPSLWRKLANISQIVVEPLYNSQDEQIGVSASATDLLDENNKSNLKPILREYVSSWRDNNIQELANVIYEDMQPYLNKKSYSKTYNYNLNGQPSKILVNYKPQSGGDNWDGFYNFTTHLITLDFQGNVSQQSVLSAVHHEITHYLDYARERSVGKQIYNKYGSDYVKHNQHNPFINKINDILYRLWDDSEINAYQSSSVYGIDSIMKYCNDLSQEIDYIETVNDSSAKEIYEWLKNKLRPNHNIDWKAFKIWFIKKSKSKLENFKKKSLKNLYLYQQNYGTSPYSINDYGIETSAMSGTPINTPTPQTYNTISPNNTLISKIQAANQYFLSLGKQFEKIRSGQPTNEESYGNIMDFEGIIKIKEDEMPLIIRQNSHSESITLKIPDTDIYDSFDLWEFHYENMDNTKYIEIGKTINIMYGKYQEFKKDLAEKEQNID